MKKIKISILIICLYCFPFVYFSMYQDFSNRSMLGYLIMIIVTSFLAYFAIKIFGNLILFIIGNILSGIFSFYFISEMDLNDRWGYYFKPFTPNSLLIFVSILNLFPQLLVIKFANEKRNKV